MKKPFDPTKPVQLADGRPARILATDLDNPFPIAAAYRTEYGEYILQYSKDGDRPGPPHESRFTLVNVPEYPTGPVDPTLPMELDDGTPVELVRVITGGAGIEAQLPKDKAPARDNWKGRYPVGESWSYYRDTGVFAGQSASACHVLRNRPGYTVEYRTVGAADRHGRLGTAWPCFGMAASYLDGGSSEQRGKWAGVVRIVRKPDGSIYSQKFVTE